MTLGRGIVVCCSVAYVLLGCARQCHAQAYKRVQGNAGRERRASPGNIGRSWSSLASSSSSSSSSLSSPSSSQNRIETRQVSVNGAVSGDTLSYTDPYTATVERFRAAEDLVPFTFLEDEPLTCSSQFSIASTDTHPDVLVDTPSCFDFCASDPTCAYIYLYARQAVDEPFFCELFSRCNRMHLQLSRFSASGQIIALAERRVAEDIDGLWVTNSDGNSGALSGWVTSDPDEDVQALLVRTELNPFNF